MKRNPKVLFLAKTRKLPTYSQECWFALSRDDIVAVHKLLRRFGADAPRRAKLLVYLFTCQSFVACLTEPAKQSLLQWLAPQHRLLLAASPPLAPC